MRQPAKIDVEELELLLRTEQAHVQARCNYEHPRNQIFMDSFNPVADKRVLLTA
jgi:hypothetical protein